MFWFDMRTQGVTAERTEGRAKQSQGGIYMSDRKVIRSEFEALCRTRYDVNCSEK